MSLTHHCTPAPHTVLTEKELVHGQKIPERTLSLPAPLSTATQSNLTETSIRVVGRGAGVCPSTDLRSPALLSLCAVWVLVLFSASSGLPWSHPLRLPHGVFVVPFSALAGLVTGLL